MDTTYAGGNIWKMLLGAVNDWFDDDHDGDSEDDEEGGDVEDDVFSPTRPMGLRGRLIDGFSSRY